MPKAPTASTRKQAATLPPLIIEMPEFDLQFLNVTLIGDSPLICHAWSAKAKKEMLDKQMKKAQEARAAKDPDQDFRDCLYPMPDGEGYGFPAIAFKSAAVDGCSYAAGITKVEARGAFHINGDLMRLDAPEPRSRQDMVKISMGTADIRYRAVFYPWKVTVPLRYNAGVLSAAQIIHLFKIAGFAVGVGEWRPQKDGSFGMFHPQ